MRTWRCIAVLAIVILATSGCGADDGGPGIWDTGTTDTGTVDTAVDNPWDTSTTDTGGLDTTAPDVPADLWDDQICDEEDLPLEYEVRSDVLIVLDRSGSMMMTLNAVKTAVNTIVGSSDDQIWFGLMPFPNSVAPGECRLIAPATECAPPVTPHVMLGPDRAPDVSAVLADLSICGSTPTSRTLANAHTYLSSTATGHDRYVLLATDGVPNCNDTLDGSTCTCMNEETGCVDNPIACLDDEATYDALDDLLADGVKTYVLGMGMGLASDIEIMNNMAEHGGTGSFYPAEAPAEILSAFEDIMSEVVVSCRFDLNPSEEADPDKVNFYIDGTIIPRDEDHINGWDYVDSDTVEFYGPWCDHIMSGGTSGVSAAYGCPTYII